MRLNDWRMNEWFGQIIIQLHHSFLYRVVGFQFSSVAQSYTTLCDYTDCSTPVRFRASLVAQLVKNPPAMQETLVRFLDWEDNWRRDRLPTPVFLGFPCDSAGKESTCNMGDLGLIPGLGRSPGEGKGNSLQYSGLENSMDCTVYGVAKSWTRLSDFHFLHFRGVSPLIFP